MTEKIGNVLEIKCTAPAVCDYCKQTDELRPYGRNGANICFDCAMKPENRATTDAAFKAILDTVSEVRARIEDLL